MNIEVENKKECVLKCANTVECRAWTYKVSLLEGKSKHACWLKSDESRKGKDDDYITGTKSCGPGKFPIE